MKRNQKKKSHGLFAKLIGSTPPQRKTRLNQERMATKKKREKVRQERRLKYARQRKERLVKKKNKQKYSAYALILSHALGHVLVQVLGPILYFFPSKDQKNAGHSNAKPNPDKKLLQTLNILGIFAWFCGNENREITECVVCSLKKDMRQMREAKHSDAFILRVLRWHVFKTITQIMWDSFRRFLSAVVPVGKIISKIKGL